VEKLFRKKYSDKKSYFRTKQLPAYLDSMVSVLVFQVFVANSSFTHKGDLATAEAIVQKRSLLDGSTKDQPSPFLLYVRELLSEESPSEDDEENNKEEGNKRKSIQDDENNHEKKNNTKKRKTSRTAKQ
jgi:hypothetical protein